jgi:hypothetical protein
MLDVKEAMKLEEELAQNVSVGDLGLSQEELVKLKLLMDKIKV